MKKQTIRYTLNQNDINPIRKTKCQPLIQQPSNHFFSFQSKSSPISLVWDHKHANDKTLFVFTNSTLPNGYNGVQENKRTF